MSEISFVDSTETFTAPPIDNTPSDSTPEYPCVECGQALDYQGRGRKPKRCSVLNGGDPTCIAQRKGSTSTTGTRSKASNDKLAGDAVAVLTSSHEFLAIGALLAQLLQTSNAITKANETFATRAHAALVNDPALCRKIIAMGSKGGKAMLIGAYAAFIGSVVPVAVVEYRAMRAEKSEG